MKGKIRKLITLGPSSFKKKVIRNIEKNTYLFRINLSHTKIKNLEKTIKFLKKTTKVPICIDSEGAQIRNGDMLNNSVLFKKNTIININKYKKLGDKKNIYFYPDYTFQNLKKGDLLKIDFNKALIKIIKRKNKTTWLSKVLSEGIVGSNKGVDSNRKIDLKPITTKDFKAIKLSKKLGVRHFSLSFADSKESVLKFKKIIGKNSIIISKITNSGSFCVPHESPFLTVFVD